MWSFSNWLHQIPFFRITMVFIAGILLNRIVDNPIAIYLVLGIFAFFTLSLRRYLVSYFFLSNNELFFWSILLLFGFINSELHQNKRLYTEKVYGKICAVVQSVDKEEKGNSVYHLCTTIKDKEEVLQLNFILTVRDTNAQSVLPGYLMNFNGTLYPIESNGNPHEFDYRKFMHQQGITHRCYVSIFPEIIQWEPSNFRIIASRIQYLLLRKFKESDIECDQNAVLAALVLGNKKYLQKELRQSYASAGAMHVLAVSGLHVGIFFLILNKLLFFLNRTAHKRIIKAILVVLFLWGYAFITGLSASVLRASTMFTFVAIGVAFRKHTNIYNTIYISALFLLLFDPDLIYDIGFQLSYAAVLSIVFFQPRIASLFQIDFKPLNWCWQLFSVSLAAQIGTLPLVILYFHQFPVYFWLSNFVVIPMAGIILYLSIVFLLTSSIGIINTILAWLLNIVVGGLNFSIRFIESLPNSVLPDLFLREETLVLLYGLVVLWVIAILSKRFRYVLAFLLLIDVFMFFSLKTMMKTPSDKLFIFNNYQNEYISLVHNKHMYHFTTDTMVQDLPDFLKLNTFYEGAFQDTILPFNCVLALPSGLFSIMEKENNYFIIKWEDCGIDSIRKREIRYYSGKSRHFKPDLTHTETFVSKYDLNINDSKNTYCIQLNGAYVLELN